MVVYYGDCEIKTNLSLPENTFVIYPSEISTLVQEICSSNMKAKYPDKQFIISMLNEAVRNGEDEMIIKQHQRNIEEFIG